MEIQKLTAVSLGKKIKEKEISVREALDAVFAQIDQTEGRYHAYVTLDKEGAYKQADAVQNVIVAMDNLLQALRSEWEGDAMRGYEDRYAKIKPSFTVRISLIILLGVKNAAT